MARVALCSLLAAWWPTAARADLYVVVHPDNPVRALTAKEVTEIFLGRTRAFSSGEFAVPLDLPAESPARVRFYETLTGVPMAQVNSYWSRLMFSGQVTPPRALPDEASVGLAVRRQRGAIGYLTQEPADASLRVVAVVRTPAP